MNNRNPRSTASLIGHPIHPMLVPFPIVFFISAFVSDLLLVRGGSAAWAEASIWLLGAGVVTALLAALAGFTDFLGERRIRALRDAWMHMLGNLVAVAIEAVNLLLRLDNPEFAASTGVILSGIVVGLLAFTGWKGGELVFRHRVGVRDGSNGHPG
jgi:uncharacterized membrane protein